MPAPPSKTDISNGRGGIKGHGPPALPPRGVSIRSRDSSMNRDQGIKPPPPAVPPKRSSLTRSDLALFSAENVRFFLNTYQERFLYEMVLKLFFLPFH